jgi:hypothetical protein
MNAFELRGEPIQTTYNTVFRLYEKGSGEEAPCLLVKLAYNIEGEASCFLLEAVASRIVEDLGLTFIRGIDSVVKLNHVTIKELLDYEVPKGEYLAALIYPVERCVTLTALGRRVFEEEVLCKAFWKFIDQLVDAGERYGFVHSDLHTNNVLYDLDSESFVLIDLGRARFDPELVTVEEDVLVDLWMFLTGAAERTVPPEFGLEMFYYMCPEDEFVRGRWGYLMILFDIVGLLYYMKYFTIPEKVVSMFRRLRYLEGMGVEMLCLTWFYGWVVATGNNLQIENKWYLRVPNDRRLLDRFYSSIDHVVQPYPKKP